MGIVIREINVRNLGPIDSLAAKLGRFNLIFGHNEKGKTALVEFVIRALFKHSKMWSLRKFEGRGKVSLTGLTDDEAVEFSPASDKKLEDYWEAGNVGLPPDFSKLLVVKGAEVELAGVEGGVDKNIINRLLSSKNVLDQVQNRISKTVQSARLENGAIHGHDRAEIAAREKLRHELTVLDDLFAEIDQTYSGGSRKVLSEKKEKFSSEIEEMRDARRFLAYTVAQDLKRLKEERNRLSAEKVQDARNKLMMYRQKESDYQRKQEQQQAASEQSEHYRWLQQAREVYERTLHETAAKPKPYFLILAVAALLASGALLWFDFKYYGAAGLLAVLLFGFLQLRSYRKYALAAVTNRELETLQQSFREKFGEELDGLPDILEKLHSIEGEHNRAQVLEQQVTDDLNQLRELRVTLSGLIQEIAGDRKEPGTWDQVIRLSEDHLRKLENRINEKQVSLAQLNVDETDYESQPQKVNFSQQRLDELEQKRMEVETQLQQELQTLDSLKHRICQQTGDDISTGWETIIEHLREKRAEVAHDYKERTAEILGKIAVSEVIETLRQEEESKIVSRLAAPEIQTPLFQLTNRYKRLQLRNDNLYVSDAYSDFLLSDLSTGAQEQILLALRIGFSTKIMQQDSIFLILDDAFQYSDWQRRKLLVEKAADLAEQGWQILYFSMDDHIRELFDAAGKRFGDAYRFISLNQ